MKRFIIVVFALLFTVQLFAQKENDSLKLKLNPVTITATRYPEYVHEIPYAVSILTSRDFLNVKPFGFDEMLLNVP
ncbi:MAG: hypothetical protein HYV28_01820 [Ignavibacteriales bacterium]|nr:hypothetical protein [Ignavibacteriales bacterium]